MVRLFTGLQVQKDCFKKVEGIIFTDSQEAHGVKSLDATQPRPVSGWLHSLMYIHLVRALVQRLTASKQAHMLNIM